MVTPEYFHLMDMRLLRGRLFNEFDNEKADGVAVINETMAKTYWPNEDPLGKQLKISRSATAWTKIVGIVADARTESLEDARVPELFLSLYQKRDHHLAIFLRGHLDAAAIPEEVREQVQAVDATIPVFGAQMLNETVSVSLSERRFSMEMVGLFAVTALMLAGLGIYGVISYLVSERTHEIGIRMALGAQRANIMRMVLRQGLGLAVAGTAIGLICALIVSHLMAGLLYGVNPTDPLTFASVAVLLIGVAVLACYIPARRAIRVDPMMALRHE
jgi:putative ABC transport system permease protein